MKGGDYLPSSFGDLFEKSKPILERNIECGRSDLIQIVINSDTPSSAEKSARNRLTTERNNFGIVGDSDTQRDIIKSLVEAVGDLARMKKQYPEKFNNLDAVKETNVETSVNN